MAKLQLTPAASISQHPEGVLLTSDLGTFHLHGRDVLVFIQELVPLLNGQFDLAEICQQLDQYADASIEKLIQVLRQQGLVEDCDAFPEGSPPWLSHERFLRSWPKSHNQRHLSQCSVLVIGLEPWAQTAVEELALSGVGRIHCLDSAPINIDDQLFQQGRFQSSKASSRAHALQQHVTQLAPWCELSFSDLSLNDAQQLQWQDTYPALERAWDLVLVTLAEEAASYLEASAHFIYEHGLRALYGCMDGLNAWIGPVVGGVGEPCWNCLRLRRLGADANPALSHTLNHAALNNRETHRSRSVLRSMSNTAGQQLSTEALKLLLGFSASRLHGHVQVHHLVKGEACLHRIIPVPWCEVCGFSRSAVETGAGSGVRTAVALSAAAVLPESASNPLNHLHSLDDLTQLFAGWIDAEVGVIKSLRGHLPSIPEFPRTASADMANFTAGQFDPRSMGQVGSGKGLDDISAHISAVGEAIERYSAARFHKPYLKYASCKQLQGDYLDPAKLVLYSKKQYQSEGFPFAPWREKQKIHWTKGRWLGSQKPVWVPALVSYFNFESTYEEQFTQVSSNGLAAGQNNEDAALRACFELIERDAMMLTWYAQLPAQRLRIDSQYHGKMRLLIDHINAQGIELELYLFDVGLHVPTVVCLGIGDGIRTPAVSVSLSCHGDIQVAMKKALLEQGHVLPYLCHLMSSQSHFPQTVHEVRELDDHATYYLRNDKLAAFDFMRQPLGHAISPEQWPYPPIVHEQQLKERLKDSGVEIAIVDVTAPDVALSPFRVARAVGHHIQPIHFGEQFKRVDNPRLRRALQGRAVNPEPHPIA
jgi:ribosomal protein S12 methylthiotransferase accessory factor